MEKGSRFGCLLKGEGIFVFMGVTKNYKQNNVLGRGLFTFFIISKCIDKCSQT